MLCATHMQSHEAACLKQKQTKTPCAVQRNDYQELKAAGHKISLWAID